MDKIPAVSKSAFWVSMTAMTFIFLLGVLAYSSHGQIRQAILWMMLAVAPLAMVTGMISGYAAEYSAVCQQVAETRARIGLLNQTLRLSDRELERIFVNRMKIVMIVDGEPVTFEMQKQGVSDLRQAIEQERCEALGMLDTYLDIPKPPSVAWWEKYILPQLTCR